MTDIEEIITEMEKAEATLVELPAETFNSSQEKIVEKLVEKNGKTIIISVTRPGKNILEKLVEKGIDKEKITVIDTVTKTQEKDTEDTENIVYVDNPSSLTEISIAIDRKMKEGGTVLILDSINSLQIHNKDRILKKFVHGILTKSRIKNIPAVLLATEGQLSPDMRADIAQLCDRTFSLDV